MRINEMIFFEVVLVFISLWNIASCGHQYYTAKRQVDVGIINPSSFPHLVLIGYERNFGLVTWACSGAIIDQRKVVTHVDCVKSSQFGAPKAVRHLGKTIGIMNFTTSGDIAVLFLREFLPRNQISCLSATGDSNGTIIIGGWGGLARDNEEDGTINAHLSAEHLEIFEESKNFIKARPHKQQAEEAFFECVADKGGPIQVETPSEDECSFHVLGVLSKWDNCGQFGSFGVYIPLKQYVKWIQSL